jgi:hypothetical protein
MALNNFTHAVAWSEFTDFPVRPPNEDEDANISTHMSLSYTMGRKGRSVIVDTAEVDIVVVSDDSWIVSSKKTNDLLRHEQGHFDIQALIAREFYNSIFTLTGSSADDLRTKLNSLQARLQRSTNATNIRYDTATVHSTNTAVQQVWDQKLDAAKNNVNGTVRDLP